MTVGHVPEHLPGDLGEHDPRRQEHPERNHPGAGGHEVKVNSAEVQGTDNRGPVAAQSDSDNLDPSRDNTAEHALEGGSTETMDRSKRQNNSNITGHRTDEDAGAAATRAGSQQQSTSGQTEYGSSSGVREPGYQGTHHTTGSSGVGEPGYGGAHNTTGSSSIPGSGYDTTSTGTGYHGTAGSAVGGSGYDTTGSSLGREALGGVSGRQTGTEPISGVRGSGIAGEPYDAGNVQQAGYGGSAPQHQHQDHHLGGTHTTRAGELLDPATNNETGIPGYVKGPDNLQGSGSGYTQ